MQNELLQYVRAATSADLVRDLLDVLITYYIFYRVALVLKGTRGMQVVVGLVLVFILYVVAEWLRLRTVLTLLTAVLSSAILVGVVVFQNDIRRGLMRVGARARFGTAHSPHRRAIDDVTDAATTLARHRTGAIITFEQDANLDEFVGSHTGHRIDAAITPELLVALFLPEAMNKLHDGAVIIRDLRIAKAGVFFPMPQGRVSDESFGSRHRAAMGITEETDAVVIVVSEERGSISFCFNGNIISNLDGPKLKAALEGVFAPRLVRRRWWWPFGTAPAPHVAPAARPVQPKATVPPSAPSRPIKPQAPQAPAAESVPAPLRKRGEDDDGRSIPGIPALPPNLATASATTTLTSAEHTTSVRGSGAAAPKADNAPKPLRKSAERNSEPPPPERAPRPKDEGVLLTPLGHLAPSPEERDAPTAGAARPAPPDVSSKDPNPAPRVQPDASRPMPRADADESPSV